MLSQVKVENMATTVESLSSAFGQGTKKIEESLLTGRLNSDIVAVRGLTGIAADVRSGTPATNVSIASKTLVVSVTVTSAR